MTLRNLDRYTADVGGPATLTPREDREAGERDAALARVKAAAESLLRTATQVHQTHGLNLCDVISYGQCVLDAIESEAEAA